MSYKYPTATNRRGLPKIGPLSKTLSYKNNKENWRRCFLSLLKTYELSSDELQYDLTSIVNIRPSPKLDRFSGINYKKLFKAPDFEFEVKEPAEFYFDSPKGGPNGSPGWYTCYKDIIALSHSRNRGVWSNIYWFINKFRIQTLAFAGHPGLKELNTENFQASRICFIPDKAGKTRKVAIGDILTQTLLKPFHEYFNVVLRRLPTDFTFNQDAGRAKIFKATQLGTKVYSFDLKDATDILPQELVFRVASDFLGDELAQK